MKYIVKSNLLIEIEEDLNESNITQATIQERFTFRKLIDNHQVADKCITETNKTWTEEHKKWEDEEI